MTVPVVEAREVTRHYPSGGGEVTAVVDASLAVAAGELVAITGPSGAGKSTLLHLLGALDRPTSGSILLEGVPIEALPEADRSALRRRRMGFVFQFFHLLPMLDATENVMVPALLDGASRRSARQRAIALLEELGLGHRLAHGIDSLSGGELQRVALARALVQDPPLLLADEPTGNLDSTTGADVLDLLLRCAHDRGKAVVVVTHDHEVAQRADREIGVRDGRVGVERAGPAGP